MEPFRYKAFISYSHRDERWAAWLQRALEKYRVPRRLAGQAAEHGAVPARLRPVFRDREDLSSASDLSSRIKQELAASETLIVVCSPAAAESRWVSEELRYFRELGREDRILALVVDGDPAAAAEKPGCFPSALLEAEDGGLREPLAADARRYADGKHLALLKIVAGILGVRLDELRRRDAQRRLRRRVVNTAVAVSLGLVIAWLFHSAQSSGEALRLQRSNTEEYLDFMLGNLGRLDPIPGLEVDSPHDGEVEHQVPDLGLADLENEVLLERALKWRAEGMDYLWEAKLDQAMTQFEYSREALIELRQRDRASNTALFELGQTEYYVGETHVRRGEIDEAQWHWYRYGVLTRRLVNAEPYNPDYVMELAYTLVNIGAVEQQKLMPDFKVSLERLNQGIQFNRIALGLEPGNLQFENSLTTMLEWAADAHMGLCSLGEALEFRQQTTARRREMVQRGAVDFDGRMDLAQTLSGLGGVQQAIGLYEPAMNSFEEVVAILDELSAEKPEEVALAWESAYREVRWARLVAENGDPERAAKVILENAPRIEELATAGSVTDKFIATEAALFELDRAHALLFMGDRQEGGEHLRQAVARLAGIVADRPTFRPGLDALVQAYFDYWQHFGSGPGERVDRLVERFPVTPQSVQSCNDADLAARLAVMSGDMAQAEEFVGYALDKGYYAPRFIDFCRRYGFCQAP